MILYCVLTSAINAVTSVVLALAVYLRRSQTEISGAFGWFSLSVALWSVSYFQWQTADTDAEALLYTRILTAAAILIPVAYFHFATVLLGRLRRAELVLGYSLAATFVILSFSGSWLVAGVEPRAMFPHWPVPGWFYPAYLLTFFYYVSITLFLLVVEYRKADGLRRNQLRLVALGTAIGFGGGATNFLLWFQIPIPPVGNGLVAVYVLTVGYAMIRFRLMDFDLIVARSVAYTLVTGILALLTPLIILTLEHLALIAPLKAGYGILYLASFVTTFAIGWTLPWLRRKTDSFLEQKILGDRLADRKMLRALAAQIGSAQDETELFARVVSGTSEALDVSMVAIYTRTEFESDFHRRAASIKGRPSLDGFPEPSLLAQTLKEGQRGVLLDEVVHGSVGELRAYFSEIRQRQNIELAVPIIGDSFFYGFIALGPRGDRALYDEIDISLLEAIGLQVGLSLRARQLERRANQTDKLIALGTLAAGLAHEIRNPLTSIQTFSALLREQFPDPEALREFSSVVQRDVDRIANIVENVATFAESNKVSMTTVNLPDVLRTVIEIVRPEIERKAVTLEFRPATVLNVRGNHSQLMQVFLNLVQNALQAMEDRPGSRLVIKIEPRIADLPRPQLCATVEDNGPGIDPALVPRIFEPFTTTKSTGERRGKHGMGLGLAIVKRIVQHHHGEIQVSSLPGKGATFRVYLPQSS